MKPAPGALRPAACRDEEVFVRAPAPKRSVHSPLVLATRARLMRFAPTPSEAALWAAIRGRRLGVQFRRQVPIGRYIVDFAASEARLVLEVDGGYHGRREGADAQRDEALGRAGWRVVRVSADAVLGELEVALARIRAALAAPE
jgi:very-short-patch-repair endonuclease